MAQEPKADNGRPAESPVELAAFRLERALSLLESRVNELASRADATNGGLFDFDRSKLASELDAARARERELEEAGAEASQALGEAIEGIKRALERVGDA